MATAFTHAFVGGALSQAAPAPVRGAALAVLLAGLAAAPDLDVLGLHLGIPYGHPLGHRGLSHSLPFALACGAALASCMRRHALGVRLRVAAVATLATASHGLLDAMTDAGLGVGFLLPFDETRSFLPWRPLPTSPLSVRRFFSGGGGAILAVEAAWVWLPVTLVLLAARLRRGRAGPGA